MSHFDYQHALNLKNADTPFYALIMAAMMRADLTNLDQLRRAYPAVYEELRQRYHAPGGFLPGEPLYEQVNEARRRAGMPTHKEMTA